MIASMTAFSRQDNPFQGGELVWELKSVNHRFLDIYLRLPESLRHLEPVFRETISAQLKRGKVEATLKFNQGELTPLNVQVNAALVKQLAAETQKITELFHNVHTNAIDVLTFPGVLQVEEVDRYSIEKAARDLLNTTLDDLVIIRQREGGNLKAYIVNLLQGIREQMQAVKNQVPIAQELETNRIRKRFQDLHLELDPLRLEQEMLLLIQKVDIAEELQRLYIHLNEMERILEVGDVVGRRLDFLLQELLREVNTMGSKSVDAKISHACVEMKVLLEQIREQVQNVE